ncbi:MAG: fused isobutyryl-CoA mutase/GTPase IcmF [Candidatus Hodarchaeales archaeon]|jgi:methylmalonyl-CoA mutase
MTISMSADSSDSQEKSEIVQEVKTYSPKNKIRFVTAASLFDGHDASINMIRRLLQRGGCEVIHLGHNRSVADIVNAAIEEDAQGIAISSYQGGHMEFFKYMYDMLQEKKASQIKIFGGGGGVIVPEEIIELESYGITKIFSPEDGTSMGLQGMINFILERTDFDPASFDNRKELPILADTSDFLLIAHYITALENGTDEQKINVKEYLEKSQKSNVNKIPVIGITGTGGAGKSSLTDELTLRFLNDFPNKTIAVLSVDPSKKKTGGALLGDRIRMNAISSAQVYMRSFATRGSQTELSATIPEALNVVKQAGFDIIIVETSGIGQGDSAIVEIADIPIFVMTPEYGASIQLEKIEMIDLAEIVVINKFDRRGAEDALRDVRKQFRRTHEIDYQINDEQIPIFGTIASSFNDSGVNCLYVYLLDKINKKIEIGLESNLKIDIKAKKSEKISQIIPPDRVRYLSEITQAVRDYKEEVQNYSSLIDKIDNLTEATEIIKEIDSSKNVLNKIASSITMLKEEIPSEVLEQLDKWPEITEQYENQYNSYKVRGKEVKVDNKYKTLSGSQIPKISLPNINIRSELIKFLMLENLPGYFPYTAGVFPFKRKDEDPKRQFAGEGPPERTNARFHLLTRNDNAKRLSTAFDSVTLYGQDPDQRPDIYGKVGESGVSICTLNDMKKLYKGFDLLDPNTSVSMTINGPAPILLAFFFNTALDFEVEKFKERNNKDLSEKEFQEMKFRTLRQVRGTVQADILKEDQAQNTCIFSVEFALKMMGDIQQYFIDNEIKNYYSVSISGYHIAEAGANPISQLAFTLANGFTYVEYYLSRGMEIDDFAPNLSFFFSNGLDAEYTVIGRVARRIWAIAMKRLYNASKRSQKLKYHIQTSGRSLHAQEVDFNDIRTTLQALMAYYDNCNSLHTNAYDEAVTTPTEDSVRRAMAIQLIIARELGWAKSENPLQGSYFIDELTDLVEEAVLAEFDRLSSRNGVLGAMELGYQRMKIQEESLLYERLKHSGELPIVGVNTFLKDNIASPVSRDMNLTRSTYEEKDQQIANLNAFIESNKDKCQESLQKLKQVALDGENIFQQLMETVRYASLGQISQALFEVGGAYRRSM